MEPPWKGRCRDREWNKRDLDTTDEEQPSVEDPSHPEYQPKPLHERLSRSLVLDHMVRKNGNSVEDLCSHAHSVGPGYANRHERKYCRMTDKTIWPFCDVDADLVTDCFEEDSEILAEDGVSLAKRETHWDDIEHWNPDGRRKRDLQGTGALVLTNIAPTNSI